MSYEEEDSSTCSSIAKPLIMSSSFLRAASSIWFTTLLRESFDVPGESFDFPPPVCVCRFFVLSSWAPAALHRPPAAQNDAQAPATQKYQIRFMLFFILIIIHKPSRWRRYVLPLPPPSNASELTRPPPPPPL